jgi:hypothetical protein
MPTRSSCFVFDGICDIHSAIGIWAEIINERSLFIDPSTVWRWVQQYAPELNVRIRRELKPTNGSRRTDMSG